MAGSISLSLSQQLDSQGRPLSAGKLYFFQAGTSTPQNAYQDVALTIPHANPMTLDASGRISAFYLADGQIKIRLTDKNGVDVIAVDNLLVIGPSSGAGSPPSVDATTLLATGDVKARYGTGTLSGFVRLNGRTIGSATSGATERANADCQALFEFLWTVDANLAVSGGRGASANADWSANKTITLPDGRGRVLAALDDMGGAAAGRLTAGFFGTAATVLGAAGGAESHTLTTAQLPIVTPAGTVSSPVTDSGHFHGVSGASVLDGAGARPLSSSNAVGGNNNPATGFVSSNGGGQIIETKTTGVTVSSTFTGTSFGSGNAHKTVPPTILLTFYIKL
jgi:microcystin-dependent protein